MYNVHISVDLSGVDKEQFKALSWCGGNCTEGGGLKRTYSLAPPFLAPPPFRPPKIISTWPPLLPYSPENQKHLRFAIQKVPFAFQKVPFAFKKVPFAFLKVLNEPFSISWSQSRRSCTRLPTANWKWPVKDLLKCKRDLLKCKWDKFLFCSNLKENR